MSTDRLRPRPRLSFGHGPGSVRPADPIEGFDQGEEALFRQSPTGRMGPEGFAALVADLKANGMREPVTIHVEQDLRMHIYEGNHRLRAAHQAGIAVPTEVKYFGNVQQHGLVFPVES